MARGIAGHLLVDFVPIARWPANLHSLLQWANATAVTLGHGEYGISSSQGESAYESDIAWTNKIRSLR